MVTRLSHRPQRAEAWLMVELLAAMALLTAAVLPIAYSFTSEKKLARSQYARAVALQIVDGEFERLAAGHWRNFPLGTNDYHSDAWAATNLPPGRLVLEVSTNNLRLQWVPAAPMRGGVVVREASIR